MAPEEVENNTSTMQRLEGQCANDLFDWEITEVEVIETN